VTTGGGGMNGERTERLAHIAVERLLEHPAGANRMSRLKYRRLFEHIRRSGRYEPIVVRPMLAQPGFYEILDGRHRVGVLRELGRREAACIVWAVDDDEALMLLATLNRLRGGDDPAKRGELLRGLARRLDERTLAARLPDSRAQIAHLMNPDTSLAPVPSQAAAPECMVFFLDQAQKQAVEGAIRLAAGTGKRPTGAVRSAALAKLADGFLQGSAHVRT